MTTSNDIGPLDWRQPIVDNNGRPTNEFQRRWNVQRGNNSLIGAIETGLGPPTSTDPVDGQEYLDTSTNPYTLYGAYNGAWSKVGVYEFTELSDVPSTYTGSAYRLVRVKGDESGLEFVTPTSAFGVAFSSQDISTKPISTTIARFASPISWTLPAAPIGLAEGKVDVAPTADTLFSLSKDGVSIGSVKWASGATVPTLICPSSVAFIPGDYLDLSTPANLNGMKGAFGLSIVGTNP